MYRDSIGNLLHYFLVRTSEMSCGSSYRVLHLVQAVAAAQQSPRQIGQVPKRCRLLGDAFLI